MNLLKKLSLIAPEFNDLSEARREEYLELASSEIRANLDKALREKLIVNLGAHYMKLALKSQGTNREITSITEGKLSITYASSRADSKINSDLSQTHYGQTFLRLLKGVIITPMTRSCL